MSVRGTLIDRKNAKWCTGDKKSQNYSLRAQSDLLLLGIEKKIELNFEL